ncbi:putative MFS transporter [Stipitochalara longipes BDJ]|nr:putative MFS transporter [Stipitochalara longipes BDJ]
MASNNDKKGEFRDVNTSVEQMDREREEHLIRKIDFRLIPLVILMYLFSFLDRVNIGNARLYGLEKDLRMAPNGNQYQIAVSILFVTYCLFEVPSNLLLKKISPSRYLAIIGIVWGLIASLSGLTRTYHGLLACRVLLGLFEAGLFPGLITYLTLFYNKRAMALRVGYLFVAAAIAGAVGGLIAYGIGFMDGVGGYRAWRWILIIEGLPSIVVGILFWILMPNDLDTATFLSSEDRAFLVMRRECEVGQTASAQKFHWDDVKDGASDWKVWSFCIAQFGGDTMLYGFSIFLPTIIHGIGTWTVPQAQGLTIPVYVLGACTYLVVAWISDKSQQRALYACLFCSISIIGYGLLISNGGSKVHYTGCFLVAMGLYVAVGIPLAWLPTNLPRYGKRTFATGLQVAIGNTSGIMAPFLYPATDGPRYVKGHSITLALVGVAAMGYTLMSWWLRRENRARIKLQRDDLIEGKSGHEHDETGDRNPKFIYTC